MWNVDFTGSPTEAGEAVREGITESVDESLNRSARTFGKYFSQVLMAFNVGIGTVHVTTTGTLTATGASGVTLEIEVI